MTNLQLIDTQQGGTLVFDRNDYPLDEGLYSELYCTFFASKSNWLFDDAFGVQSESVSSRTEKALTTHNSNSEIDINLIKKAVSDDLERFKNKNPEVEIEGVGVGVYANKAIIIVVEITGNSEAFNFIYNKTEQSLDNIKLINYYDI